MLNLHHLEVFHAVAAAGSVGGGGERLMISQPAVSRQVKLLERAVGVVLLDRHPRGIRLTAAGKVLADYAGRIFGMAEEARGAMADVAGGRRGSLSVGAGPTVGVYLLPRAVVGFRRECPDVSLHTETEGVDMLRQRLADGMIELAVTETPIVGNEFATRTVLTDVLVPVAAAGHRLGKQKRVSAAEFCREPFVARQTDGPSLVERTLASRGIAVRPVMTVGSTEAIKQAVIAGVGVAMVSRMAVRVEVAAGLLAEVKVRGLSIRYPIFHVRRRGWSESVIAKRFMAILGGKESDD